MLMDILMEALMSMDDDTLDSVLESCDAEELEIISDAMEARYEDGPTVENDKKAMKKRIIDNLGRNYSEREIASRERTPDETKLMGSLRLYSDRKRNPVGWKHWLKDREHSEKIAKADAEYNKLNNYEKVINKKSHEKNIEKLKKAATNPKNIMYIGLGRRIEHVRADRAKSREETPISPIPKKAYNILKRSK